MGYVKADRGVLVGVGVASLWAGPLSGAMSGVGRAIGRWAALMASFV